MYKIKLENFEGPLDLLLFFVRRDELNIYDIPIAHITKSYLEYLQMMQELNLDVAGEFILMAATLMRIKVRSMLPPDPTLEEEEEIIDPRQELTQRLIEYRRFKEASKTLSELDDQWRQIYRRSYFNADSLPPPEPPETMALRDISFFDLLAAYKKAVTKSAEIVYHNIERLNVTIEGQRQYIIDFFGDREEYLFTDLCEGMCKIEIVVTFLALLDMIKNAEILVRQALVFDDIWIRKPDSDITHVIQDLNESPIREKPFEVKHASIKEFIPVEQTAIHHNGHDDASPGESPLQTAVQTVTEWPADEVPEDVSVKSHETPGQVTEDQQFSDDGGVITFSQDGHEVLDVNALQPEVWVDAVSEVAEKVNTLDSAETGQPENVIPSLKTETIENQISDIANVEDTPVNTNIENNEEPRDDFITQKNLLPAGTADESVINDTTDETNTLSENGGEKTAVELVSTVPDESESHNKENQEIIVPVVKDAIADNYVHAAYSETTTADEADIKPAIQIETPAYHEEAVLKNNPASVLAEDEKPLTGEASSSMPADQPTETVPAETSDREIATLNIPADYEYASDFVRSSEEEYPDMPATSLESENKTVASTDTHDETINHNVAGHENAINTGEIPSMVSGEPDTILTPDQRVQEGKLPEPEPVPREEKSMIRTFLKKVIHFVKRIFKF